MTRRTLLLDSSQRDELQRIRDHDPRPYMRERASALLKIADGLAPNWVARFGLLKPRDPDTVYQWLNRYQAQAALRPRPACRRPFSPR